MKRTWNGAKRPRRMDYNANILTLIKVFSS
jgi:hypothetical protein